MAWREHSRAYLPAAQCLAFDGHCELLWAGSLSGHVSSYFTKKEYGFSRYVTYRAHLASPTKELIVDDRGVLSVGGSIKLANRRGLAQWNVHETENYTSVAYANAAGSEIIAGGANLMGGFQPDLLSINASTGTILRKAPSPSPVSFVRRSNLICCGYADGQIAFKDPKTLKTEQTLPAHANGLSGMEAEGNFLYTYGYYIRHGVPVIDPLVKVYDVRAMRPLPPISFPSLPAFVKVHPRNSSHVVIASAQGQIQISDISNPTAAQFYSVETDSYLTSTAMSPTGEGLAFTDADGILHLWSASQDGEEPRFSRYDGPIDFPEPPEPLKRVNWTDDTPLNMIGMPYYDQQLLSVIPWDNYSSQYSPFAQPPQKIDPAILATMKTVDFVGFAVNPKTAKRNQAVLRSTRAKESKRKMDVPLFRSEKERELENRRKQRKKSELPDADDNEAEGEATRATMPKYYRKVEIKYSKFGVEDFDFAFYNKTTYSGLETHITNSYTNSLLQVLRFSEPIRKLAEGHIWTACPRENCFLCEAGFLFKILRDAKGVNCQASNFSKVFTSNGQATALGLMDFDDTSQAAYSSLIQITNRFLLDNMSKECDTSLNNITVLRDSPADGQVDSALGQLLAFQVLTVSTCSSCGHQSKRETSSNVLDFVYPRKALSNEVQPTMDFASVFKASIARENLTKSVCAGCRQVCTAKMRRRLTGKALPSVLTVNTAVHTSDHMDIWLDKLKQGSRSRFLQPRFAVNLAGDTVLSLESDNVEVPAGMVVYELQAIIVQTQTEDDPAHLLSIVKVPASEGPMPGWHVFNDFLVRPITEEEALSFPGTWKIPAVLYYQRVDAAEIIDYEKLEVPPDTSILTNDVSIARHRKPSHVKHTVLKPDELPRKGTLVSIDAEFVSLQQEEVEYRSDGTKSLIRPTRMALARVSVLRGEGPDTGIPFIDDHIQVNEPIVDYLTEFSGIKPGDLDANKSHHTLVPSKVAYKKLRLLVDLGCTFIGHGLNKDFRIINIFVPPSQILDTVNIYHLPHRHRKISLRFLSWVVLKQDIQSSGSHDSIEDARTALQLYEKYSQLEVEGKWDLTLDQIYAEGGKLGWKVPGSEKAPASPSMASLGQTSAASAPLPSHQLHHHLSHHTPYPGLHHHHHHQQQPHHHQQSTFHGPHQQHHGQQPHHGHPQPHSHSHPHQHHPRSHQNQHHLSANALAGGMRRMAL